MTDGQPEQTKTSRDALSQPASATGAQASRPAWMEKLGAAVGAHPKVAIAAAIGVGVTLGWMIKRR